MIITTYIDLGNAGVIEPSDIEQAGKIDTLSGPNLMSYLRQKISGLQINNVVIRNSPSEHGAVVTIQSSISLVSKSPYIEAAITQWFSPIRMGLNNRKLRYFTLDNKREYINTIKIIID